MLFSCHFLSQLVNSESLVLYRERLHAKMRELKSRHEVTNQDRHARKLKKQLKKTDNKKAEKEKLKQKLIKVGAKAAGGGNKVKAGQLNGAAAAEGTLATDKVSFSKLEFKPSELMAEQPKRKANDPKAALAKIAAQKERLESMAEKGLTEKVKKIESKAAWQAAIDKAEGVKVKDDVELLKKSLKRQEQRKKSSKKKWEHRSDQVDKKLDKKQTKRQDNLQQRKKDIKDNKKKKLIKKGRLLPGH